MAVNINNVIIGRDAGATVAIDGISNSTAAVVTVTDSLIATAGPNSIGGVATNNTGTGSINTVSVLNVDPQLKTNVDISDPEYFAALNFASLQGVRSGGADLDGGRILGTPPTSAKMWDMYQ
jgi:hypothetical protein